MSRSLPVRSVFVAALCLLTTSTTSLHAWSSEDYYAQLDNISLEELLNTKVSTSNKYMLSIDRSSSSITVISEDEISRHGYKTLEEALVHVVGFAKSTHVFRSLISNRGFIQGFNTNYLFLIDGQKMNDNAFVGMGREHIFPLMDNIQRIEVIRSPSSTLWGTSALNGIINIITKTGSDFRNAREGVLWGSIDHSNGSNRIIENAGYSFEADDYQYTFSAMYFDSDVANTHIYNYGPSTPVYRKQEIQYDFRPSYSFYLNSQYKDIEFTAGYKDYQHSDNILTMDSPKQLNGIGTYKKYWSQLQYNPKLTSSIDLKSRLYFFDSSINNSGYERLDNSLDTSETWTDKRFGMEVVLYHTIDNNKLLYGVKAESEQVDGNFYNTDDLEPDKKNVHTFATYLEDTYKPTQDWQLVAGARLEHTNLLGDKNVFLPRMSLFYQITQHSFAKYMYNTGSLRPTLVLSRDVAYDNNTKYAVGANKSQQSRSNEVQIGYRDNKFDISCTLYYTYLKDIISWGNQVPLGTLNNLPAYLWETNLVDITQKGIELEFKYVYQNNLQFYGNYAFADARYTTADIYFEGEKILSLIDSEYTDKTLRVAGTPRNTWNLGFDYDIKKDVALNLDYRGFEGIYSIYPSTRFELSEIENFLDINVRWKNFYKKGTELSTYIKNITDNKGRFPIGYGEIESQIGREIGVKLSIKL